MITFTQFIFPNGKREIVEIVRSPEIEIKAKALIAKGFRFEIENKDGTIWATCINHSTEQSADRMCENGPQVPEQIDDLITLAYFRFVENGVEY